jgi:predicted anti-sigma-YlaC factor YlaD
MGRFLSRFMKPDPRECEEVRSLLSDYADGELAAEVRARVDEHVGFCPRCRRVLSNLRHTLGRLGRLAETSPPGALRPEQAGERIRRGWRDQVS